MLRRDVLKGVFGGAAAVALGEMFGGKQAAEAQSVTCNVANSVCSTGCTSACQRRCSTAYAQKTCAGCEVCATDNCIAEDLRCGSTCTIDCLNACGNARTGSTCPSCSVCRPPA